MFVKLHILLLGSAAVLVSFVGATFSVSGLAKLFSGAPLAVMIMAGSLEFAKIVAAAFLHRNWNQLNMMLKIYLTTAIVALVLITSMGIFGYLSQAYQRTAVNLKNTNVKLDYLATEDRKVQEELDRLQKSIDEIPSSRITKRIETQAELEPRFQALKRQSIEIQMNMRNENLKKLDFQTEIGPVVYIAEAFEWNMDKVARLFISLFVLVFDPLAICLVVSTSHAIKIAEKEEAAQAAASTPQQKAA